MSQRISKETVQSIQSQVNILDIVGQFVQLRNRRICVVIPTYNNDKTIKTVVEKCLLYCDDVIVVTDGCTDRTTDILHAIDGITIVSYPQNRGKGYALKMGFRRALEMGFSYAITLDGDGQHYPEDIPLFLKALLKPIFKAYPFPRFCG